MTVFNYLPKNIKYGIGGLTIANKYAVLPLSKATASLVSTKFGLMTKDEAKIQEDLFDEYTKPFTKVFDQIEDEIWAVLEGSLEPLAWLFGFDNKDEDKKIIEPSIEEVRSNEPIKTLDAQTVYEYERPTPEPDLIPFMKTKKPVDIDLLEALQESGSVNVP